MGLDRNLCAIPFLNRSQVIGEVRGDLSASKAVPDLGTLGRQVLDPILSDVPFLSNGHQAL